VCQNYNGQLTMSAIVRMRQMCEQKSVAKRHLYA
jgi:hypothetical protein